MFLIIYIYIFVVQAKVFSKCSHTVQLDNLCTPLCIPKSNLGIVVFIHAGETSLGKREENLPTEPQVIPNSTLIQKDIFAIQIK